MSMRIWTQSGPKTWNRIQILCIWIHNTEWKKCVDGERTLVGEVPVEVAPGELFLDVAPGLKGGQGLDHLWQELSH